MQMRKRGVIVGILVIIVCFVIAYIMLSNKKSTNVPIKVLVIFQEDEARILLEKFKQKTGQSYEMIRMSSGEANYQLLVLNQSNIDVVLGGPADLHEQLKNSSKLLKYAPKNSDLIPDSYKDEQKFWTGMYMGPLSIGINTEKWAQDEELKDIPYPLKYEDLLIPQLKGKIDMPNPETSGTGYTLLASLQQERGSDEAISLLYKLQQQSAATNFSGITSAQRLAMGEVTTAISFLGDQLRFTNSGYSILSTIPPQAGWEIGAVSILRSSTNRSSAKQLVDFVLSSDAQTYYMNTAFSIPVEPNIEVNQLLKAVDKDNLLVNYRFDLAAERRDSLLTKWKAIVRDNG
ncbi:MAG: extracellular solute-binding protein [Candidatus Pristimantibacillus lignocellulolyticus]|uniref:Extracellular solute-binding protein n=1 Tax=Candidatus Pristimantibacillus lignocellulolyticus TaxID=2994561 RepID=A0A9J6ZFV2_9BACL|nr:MAG: extracellular solute-binding protein [Candidatus Pristimantibacillus lignocellulolyticus]